MNIWGNIQVYVCSYLRIYDRSVQLDQMFAVYPIQSLIMAVGSAVGTKLILYIHPQVSYAELVMIYSVMGGIGLGTIFMLPLFVGWKCFPNNKGMVSSLIFLSNGVGTIIGNIISSRFINPYNKPALKDPSIDSMYKYFEDDVSINIPSNFQNFATIELILTIIAMSLIWIPDLESIEKQRTIVNDRKKQYKDSFKIAVKSSQFYSSYMLLFFSVMFGQYIFIQFKAIGEYFGHGDQFLTIAGSVALIFNALSRLLGGIILDFIPFKTFMGGLMGLSLFLSLTLPYVGQNEIMFITYLCLIFYVYGSVYVSMPTFFAIVFGPEQGSYLYSYCFTANCFSSLLLSVVILEFQVLIGYTGILYITSGSCIIALVIVIFMNTQSLDYEEPLLPSFDYGRSRVSIYEKGRTDFTVLDCFHEYSYVSIKAEKIQQRRVEELNKTQANMTGFMARGMTLNFEDNLRRFTHNKNFNKSSINY
eukprot:403369835